jgi:hypothetical protein
MQSGEKKNQNHKGHQIVEESFHHSVHVMSLVVQVK